MEENCRSRPSVTDYLTGRELRDCGEEMVRQAIERLLVEEKGFRPEEIEADRAFTFRIGTERHPGLAGLAVSVDGRPLMTLKCAPGSLVSREREALAVSRLAFDPPPPLTVVTNGQDAELMETASGRILDQGLAAIPSRAEIQAQAAASAAPEPLTDRRREREGRIYLAYGDIQCPLECR
ncbi:MAG: type I restriction enzyme HsdR N-terminal domain-containing protein [Proteobacteria bacterium]|nr:type I restriction enzyme HsdR N-terminal domain-containing protein [Pseudomonadota bacterium]